MQKIELKLEIIETEEDVFEATIMKLGYTGAILRKLKVQKVVGYNNQIKFNGPNFFFSLSGPHGQLEVR